MSESLQIWLLGARVSEETERVDSGPEGNGTGIDPTAVAMAGASRERVDAFLQDQQELVAAQLHQLTVNQSRLALPKFAEAEKCAPNWGRLHLKWDESLLYAGRRDEAARQFEIASGLELVMADTAELARVRMDDDNVGASNVGIVSRTMLVPNYRELGPTFKPH